MRAERTVGGALLGGLIGAALLAVISWESAATFFEMLGGPIPTGVLLGAALGGFLGNWSGRDPNP